MITAIDPDMRKSGVCQLNDKGEILSLESMSIIEIIEHVQHYPNDDYVIEDVNKIKAMYARGRNTSNTRIAQNVGMCKGAGTIIIDIISHYATSKPTLAPVGLGKQFKNNAALFKQVTGYEKQTNEDKRDAYAIAHWYFYMCRK